MLEVQLLADQIKLCHKLEPCLLSNICLAPFNVEQRFVLLVLLTPSYSLQLVLNKLFLSLNHYELLLQLLDFCGVELSFLLLLCLCLVGHKSARRIDPVMC